MRISSVNMNKYLAGSVIAVLLVLLGISVYFNINRSSHAQATSKEVVAATDSDAFERKQECASYRTDIEARIKELDMENQNVVIYHFLDEIWFSPSENSCLYSMDEIWDYKKESKIQKDYSIYDFLGNRLIFHTSDGLVADAHSVFEARKAELKK